MYDPHPIDISNVAISEELIELVETLAINSHDRWAAERLRQGWNHGSERDDTNKTHPDLIPYEDLPEVDKEHDRSAAIWVLKVILACGYQIAKPS